jgi:arylsulfatase A-like enzyme
LLSLDRDLGDFFARLDSWGIDYAVALTADHGGLDIPERMRARGVADAVRIDPALTPKRVGEQVAKSLNIKGPVLMDVGPVGDLYLDPALQGPARARALAAVLAVYRAHPQVEAAFGKEEIARTPVPGGNPVNWSLLQRVRASFDAERSGDLYVVLKRNITPIADTSRHIATHGSPWDYDRRVPVIVWRSAMAAAAREEPVETIDVMPTLAAMLRLGSVPAVDGRCLAGIPGVVCPTP